MSGLDSTPSGDAAWARKVDRRLRQLENPRQVTIGQWCLSVSPISGNLVADHIPTGRRTYLAAAEPKVKETD